MPLAQQGFQFPERYNIRLSERANLHTDTLNHFGLRPFDLRRIKPTEEYAFIDSARYYYLAQVKLFRDHLLEVKEKDFYLSIDPLLDLQWMDDLADTGSYADTVRLTRNTRGLIIQAEIGKTIRLQSTFLENQIVLPQGWKIFADSLQIIPGMGRQKEFKVIGFDFGFSTSILSYSPASWIDLETGNGKKFIGHGYRSLLLSDAPFNYPYIGSNLRHPNGKWTFTWFHAGLQNLERLPLGEVPESLFKRKAIGFHYVSFAPTPWLEVGLFDATIWQRWDSSGTQGLHPLMFNPIPLANSAFFGMNGKNNTLAGLNVRVRVHPKIHVYGQALSDDISSSRMGFQAGIKTYRLGLEGLNLLLEYNLLSDRVYASPFPLQNYVHFNQPLGHPAGPGMSEIVGELHYRFRRVFFEFRYTWHERSSMPFNNPLIPEEDLNTTEIGNRPSFNLNQLDLRLGWLINPKTNLRIELAYTGRNNTWEDRSYRTEWLRLGLKTSLYNEYWDF
jgi:hypothetical protein